MANTEQPGGELRAREVILARAINPEENLLRQVLCRCRVPNHSIEEINQWRPILLQKVEGRSVPRLHVQHELDVGPGHSLHSVSNTHGAIKLRGNPSSRTETDRQAVRCNSLFLGYLEAKGG